MYKSYLFHNNRLAILLFSLLIFQTAYGQKEGTLDLTYNTEQGAAGSISQVLELKNGQTLACGTYTRYANKNQNSVAWLNDTAGLIEKALDPFVITKQGLSKTPITRALELPDGKLMFFNCLKEPRVHKYNADGTADKTFNGIGKGVLAGGQTIEDVAVQTDGKIVMVGTFTSFNGDANTNYLVRMNADGSTDTDFRSKLEFKTGTPACVEVLKNGKIIIGGDFMKVRENGGSYQEAFMIRLNSDGSIDKLYDTDGGEVRAMALQSDEKIIAALQTGSNLNDRLFIKRIGHDGSIDTTFQVTKVKKGSFNVRVYDICIQPDDKVLIGGDFVERSYGGTDHTDNIDSAFNLFRLTADGKNDTSFYLNNHKSFYPNASVNSIYYTRKGQILVGGAFLKFGAISRTRLARLNGDGKLSSVDVLQESKTITDLMIYPNPATSLLHLSVSSGDEIRDVELYNSQGEKVTINWDNQQVLLGEAARGFYILRVQLGDKWLTRRVLLVN